MMGIKGAFTGLAIAELHRSWGACGLEDMFTGSLRVEEFNHDILPQKIARRRRCLI